jgi:eukaryotic-like serine/threonine-protein kinase
VQILSALLERPGQIVTREELQKELWQDSTFVDFEQGLNSAVNKLRQALRDSADQPRYIETLPGRGYRFIAPMQVASPTHVLTIAPPLETVRSGKARVWKWRAWLPWIAAPLTACLIGGYFLVIRRQAPVAATPMRFTISPPSGFVLEAASSRQGFAVSPDGTHMAFTAMDASGLFSVFIRDFNAIEPRPLANSSGAHTVFWAPDSRSLFLSVRGSLRRTKLDGDSFQVLCDSPTFMLTGAWLQPDALLLAGRSATYMVSASGGTPKTLKELYSWPQMLPDGKHILYVVFDSRTGRFRARVATFGEPDSVRDLLEADSRVVYTASAAKPDGPGYLMYVRAGNLLAHPFDLSSLRITGEPLSVVSRIYSFHPTGAADFSVSQNGVLAYQSFVSRSQLAWVDREGRLIANIGPGDVNLKYVRLSPDGRRVATSIYDVDRGANDIWIFDAATGSGRRVILGPGLVDVPVWSPDSSRLVFNRVYDSPPKLFLRGIGDKDAEEALPPAYFQIPTDWSHDGRFIAFGNTAFTQVANEQQGDVWLIDLARQRKVVHLLNTPFHEANAVFSPDGKWLAFTSNESGQSEVYVQAFQAGESPNVVGERHLVSRQGALCLRWRSDGKELFYLGTDGRLYAVSVTLSPRLGIGVPAPLFAISTEARAALHSVVGFDVSADGRRFIVPTVTSPEKSSLVIIQNWEAALRRKPDDPR